MQDEDAENAKRAKFFLDEASELHHEMFQTGFRVLLKGVKGVAEDEEEEQFGI